MNAEYLKTIGKYSLVAIGVVALSVLGSKYEIDIDDSVHGQCGYVKAMNAIMNSNMFESDKEVCVKAMKHGVSNDIYEAVVSIVSSDSFSSTKVSMVKELFK